VLVVLGLAGLLVLAVGSHWSLGPQHVAGRAQNQPGGDVAALGRSVFTTYLFPFEITAALLVIAVVGAVVLARRLRPESADDGDEDDGTDAPPGAETVGADAGDGAVESTESVARAVAGTVAAAHGRSDDENEEVDR
jgi:NADH-quinone oxidoreductase subunit J